MKHLLTLLLLFTSTFLSADSHSMEIESLLSKLDSLITRKDDFVAAKEAKINQLHNQGRNIRTSEERYWLNKMYYDEYSVYNSDSAMIYVDQNLDIADKLNKKEWKAEWKIKKSFLLAATGLLKEALDELRNVSSQLLTPELKVEYYGQLMYLYSHFRQYSGDNNTNIREGYYEKEKAYKDSIYAYITPQDPFYLWYKGWKFLGTTETESIKKELLNEVERSSLETRRDAMNAYILACLYQDSNQQNEYLKYMIYSAMADVKTANKDIASLEELSKTLYELNDIDRAYTYINYCLQNAQLYRNRVRVIGISETQDAIHRAYQERNIRQEARLHTFLFLVSVLSIILLIAHSLYLYANEATGIFTLPTE